MNAFIRPLALGDLDGPSLAIEDTIAVAGLKTILATDALADIDEDAPAPLSRPLSPARRLSSHAPSVRRALAAGWYIDTRVRHRHFGAAEAVADGWVQAALAADFTGGLRVGAALHGICGYKPSYTAPIGGGRTGEAITACATLPMYCIGALAPDMRTLIDLAATLDDTFDEALSVPPSALNVGWLASDHYTDAARAADAPVDGSGADCSYLRAKDWSKVQGLLIDACEKHVQRAPREANDASVATVAALPSRSRTIRLPGMAHAAAAATLISRVAGRANERGVSAPAPDDLAEALHHARAFRREVDEALSDVDVLALPTLHASYDALNALTAAFNLSGHPAVTLPFIAADGRVHALQLIARQGDDARLCGAGLWFEALFARHPASQWAETAPVDDTPTNVAFSPFSQGTSRATAPRWMTVRAG